MPGFICTTFFFLCELAELDPLASDGAVIEPIIEAQSSFSTEAADNIAVSIQVFEL
jgi:hypothetical protein